MSNLTKEQQLDQQRTNLENAILRNRRQLFNIENKMKNLTLQKERLETKVRNQQHALINLKPEMDTD